MLPKAFQDRGGGEGSSAADVVRVAVGVHHRLNLKAFVGSQVEVGAEVAEGTDGNRLSIARYRVAQAASGRPTWQMASSGLSVRVRVATVEPAQQFIRTPGFVERFFHEGTPPCRDNYLGCGTTRR
jgi:hypothetical protein